MSILTEGEMDKAFDASMEKRPKDASNAETRRLFAIEVESAVLAKLAGMELPEPPYVVDALHRVWTREGFATPNDGDNLFTAAQLHQAYAQGAASQLNSEIEAYLVYDQASCSEDLFFDGELGDMDGKTITPLYTLKSQK